MVVVLLDLLHVGRGVLLVVGKLLDRAFLLSRADVAEADEVEIISVVRSDHGLAALVAGADDRGLDGGLVAHVLVTEVEAGQGGGGGGGDQPVAAGHPDGALGVFTAQLTFFGGQVGHGWLLDAYE